MNYKYYIVDDLGFTYEVKSFAGIDKVDPKDVDEMGSNMLNENGENVNVVAIIKKIFIRDVMMCEHYMEKGVSY